MKNSPLNEWEEQVKKVYKIFDKLSRQDLRVLEHASGVVIDIKETKELQILKLMVRFGIPYPNTVDFSK